MLDRITNSTNENIINNKLYLITENTDLLFSDKVNQLVCYNANLGWMFYAPYAGKMIFLQAENQYYFFNGTSWEKFKTNSGSSNVGDANVDLSECLLKENNLLDITDQDQACHNIGTLRDWEIRRVGDYKMSAQKQDHDNWFICDGREVLRNEYPELFGIISTDFGTGNGTTTFNIPNFKNRAPWGADGNLNNTINSGLPNIKGYYRPGGNWPITNLRTDLTNGNHTISSGAFVLSMEQVSIMITCNNSASMRPKVMEFDASKSNAIYGNSTIVQPPAICVNMFILMK